MRWNCSARRGTMTRRSSSWGRTTWTRGRRSNPIAAGRTRMNARPRPSGEGVRLGMRVGPQAGADEVAQFEHEREADRVADGVADRLAGADAGAVQEV